MKKLITALSAISLMFLAVACGSTGNGIPEPGSKEATAKYVPERKDMQITDEESSQGWYYGDISEKKGGTPDEWQWTYNEEDNTQSKWMEPAGEMMDY